jgi:L-fuculose-phosphate aldolase
MRHAELRTELCETLRRMAAAGLVRGTEGNASARAGDLVAISPTALPYGTLRPEDVCLVTPAGELVEGPKPSVELPMHLAVLRAREDVGAVVHTHSPRATALSLSGGGPTPVAEAAPSGSAELGAGVLEAAGDGWAVVVHGHGPVCFGVDLADALARALAVEEDARAFT